MDITTTLSEVDIIYFYSFRYYISGVDNIKSCQLIKWSAYTLYNTIGTSKLKFKKEQKNRRQKSKGIL